MGLILSRFAISKLSGWDISVKAFIEMAKPLGIDPTIFRVSTGIAIAIVVLGYLLSAFYTLLKPKLESISKVPYTKFVQIANLAGILTMTGALFAEFLLREQPKWLLVYIAIGIILFSIVNLNILKTKKA